ncbi:SPOR domain-containing protein [Xanthovirga aplysinae]|uniref:SPOR domain-containing protein n=1 Tax=Xanthovirga aplysinae TaxID=2529853 RepID=UPI0012BC6A12|nr:SPOR domain-containing protein [Xanthovirga aplysinae]MTI32645.1 hypothetical protein [Xanthovirga aplysinae]
MRSALVWITIVGIFFSCSNKISKSKSTSAKYEEDLAVYRPQFDGKKIDNPKIDETKEDDATEKVIPEHDVTAQLNATLDSIASFNQQLGYVDGYRIQVYIGQSREKAIEVRNKVYTLLPSSRPEVEYNQPNYKVKVGKFFNRLEAQKMYTELKADFPNVIVVPQRIQLGED